MQQPQPQAPYHLFIDEGSLIIGEEEQYQIYLQQQFATSQAQSIQSFQHGHDQLHSSSEDQRLETLRKPDEQDPSSRPRLTAEQTRFFEQRYQEDPRPKTETKGIFARDLGLHIDKVNNWFQNRRAKSRHLQKIQFEYLDSRHTQGSDMTNAASSMWNFHTSDSHNFGPDQWSSMADYAAGHGDQPGLLPWELIEDARVSQNSLLNHAPLARFPPAIMPSTIVPSDTDICPISDTFTLDNPRMDLPLRRARPFPSAEDVSACSLSRSLGTLTTQTSIATSENEDALLQYASYDPLPNALGGWEVSVESFESESLPSNLLEQTRTTSSSELDSTSLPCFSDAYLPDEPATSEPSPRSRSALQQPDETLRLSRSNLAARRNRQRPAPLRSASSAMPHLLSPVPHHHGLRHTKSTGYGMNLAASRIHKQGASSNPRSPLNRSTFQDDGAFDRVASFVDQQAHELRTNSAQLTPAFYDASYEPFLTHRLPFTPPDSSDQRFDNLMFPGSASLCPEYANAIHTPLSQAFSHSLTHTSPSSFQSIANNFDGLHMSSMAPPQSAPAHLAHFPPTSPPGGHVLATPTFYDVHSQPQQQDTATPTFQYQPVPSTLQQAISNIPSPRPQSLYVPQSVHVFEKSAPASPALPVSPSAPSKKEQEWEFVHHDQAQMVPGAVSIPLRGQPLVFQFVGPENFREGREIKGR